MVPLSKSLVLLETERSLFQSLYSLVSLIELNQMLSSRWRQHQARDVNFYHLFYLPDLARVCQGSVKKKSQGNRVQMDSC